jgi:D-alanyl-D-alanine dipeptidase
MQSVMVRYGFDPYDKEWWHFTLANEPFPDQYFNFPVA